MGVLQYTEGRVMRIIVGYAEDYKKVNAGLLEYGKCAKKPAGW